MALVTFKSPTIAVAAVKGHNPLNQIQELCCFSLGLMSNLVRGHMVS